MVRTRFAPSPTGFMHIGNLRTALFEYLIAKSNGGAFILRIEDTDSARRVEGAEQVIYSTLSAAGLAYDEGPIIGGPFAPYVQSERKTDYLKQAAVLIEKKRAYYCFCEKNAEKRDAEKYDRRCLALSPGGVQSRLSAGAPFVIRQFIPKGETVVRDLVYGGITVSNDEIEDQILIKSDKTPTYNFANVVDDHFMQITHVARGSEYLSSAPKYNLLYEAFGWEIPVYVHLPLILDENGDKLSKRAGAASFFDLLDMGFLPEAVVNYIALLGFSPPGNNEVFSLEELTRIFDMSRINKAPSRFDIKKLSFINGEHFKKMSDGRFFELALPYVKNAVTLKNADYEKLAAMVKTRIGSFRDIANLLDFFDACPPVDTALFVNKKMKSDLFTSKTALEAAFEALREITAWQNDILYGALLETAQNIGYKNSQVLWPLRVALSGKGATPCGGSEIMEILGKEESLKRVKAGLDII